MQTGDYGFYLPTGALSFWLKIGQRGGFHVFERHILGHKTGERLGEDLYLKGAEKEYKIASFLE